MLFYFEISNHMDFFIAVYTKYPDPRPTLTWSHSLGMILTHSVTSSVRQYVVLST